MATKNPRISVMLTPASDAILRRLSKASGQSKSGIIAEFLEDACMPMFERMATVLEAAATATDEAKTAARQGFQDAENKLLEVMGMTTDLFDSASRPLLDDAEGIKRRSATGRVGRGGRAAAPAACPEPAPLPPHVTRGSGTPNKGKSTAKTTMGTGAKEPSLKKSSSNPSKQAVAPSKRKVGG